MSVCPDNNWDSYSYNTDNGPVIAGFHTDADEIDEDQYPYCARVIISIKDPNDYGGPQGDEAQVLWDMEDQLVAALDEAKVSCLLLGRLTHSGKRELVFQVTDYEPFRPPVGRWIGQHENYETDVSEHDGWGFFFDSVWPSDVSWQLIHNRRVVDSLIESGSDPSKPHSLEFVFNGDNEILREMQAILTAKGYSLLDHSLEDSRLIMAQSMTLDLGEINRESLSHQEDCERLGIEYDGWGALTVS
jgi:regulator of RNase E activity RraB